MLSIWTGIELSFSINFFVGDKPIIQREMEGSDEGEVSLKEVKDTVLLLAKQMVELKAAMGQREDIASRSIGESSRLRDQVWSWKRASRGNCSFSTLQGSKTS